MAGMFYSLEEAVEKLNMTEEQIKDLVREGKLREFRDGSNLLFKIDEIEALMSGKDVAASEGAPAAAMEAADTDEISLVPEATVPETAVPEAAAPETPVPEIPMPEIATPETPTPEAATPETPAPEIPTPETPAPETPAPETPAPEIPTPEIPTPETPEAEIPTPATPEATEDTVTADELTDADTVVAEEGINVLGETDSEYEVTDDTGGGTKGTTAEASLEEIEEDVNLDTFGSGSGLLDLSLQADDTSLGGILDEIYTSEGEENQEAREGSALEVAVDADEQMLPGEELAGPQPPPGVPAVVQGYIEPEPDTISNAFGIVLFLPLLVIVYTAIIAVAGFNDVMPVIREKIQDIIWFVMIGVAVAAGLIVGVAFMLTSGGGGPGKKRKAKKPKRAKKKARPAPES